MKIDTQKIGILVSTLFVVSSFVPPVNAYLTSGNKWSGTSASYYINSSFASSFRTAFQSADATWDAAGSKFRINYSGTTSRNPNTGSSTYKTDSYNDIGYANDGATGYQAATTITLSGTTIKEVDTTLNTYYGFSTTGASGHFDVQDTMTHEFGHWLRLKDASSHLSPYYCSYATEATLCGSPVSVEDTNRRSLTNDDKNGIISIYGT